jgi:hypothetical protein
MTAPRDTAIRRSLRRFTLGTGPLKRRSDRLQVLGRTAVAVSLVISPPLAVATAGATTAHLQEVADVEAADRSPTSARLLDDAGTALPEGSARVQVRAEWATDDGTPSEGLVLAEPGSAAGTEVPIWVDGAGHVTRAPLDRTGIRTSAVAAAVLPLIGVPAITWTLYALLCCTLDARRDRRWEQEWAAVEPDWHSRLL